MNADETVRWWKWMDAANSAINVPELTVEDGQPRGSSRWGYWGIEPPCEHIRKLRGYLRANGLGIWGEDTTDGWVNLSCETCGKTYGLTLKEPFAGNPE